MIILNSMIGPGATMGGTSEIPPFFIKFETKLHFYLFAHNWTFVLILYIGKQFQVRGIEVRQPKPRPHIKNLYLARLS